MSYEDVFPIIALAALLGIAVSLLLLLVPASRSKGRRWLRNSVLILVGAFIAFAVTVEETPEQAAIREAQEVERAAASRAAAAARGAERAAEAAREATQAADDRRRGFHCLSDWDGSHADFKSMVRQTMREPDSFEHIETRITPVDDKGYHSLLMDYRARNGFGGMNVGRAAARVRQSDCSFTILAVE